MTVSACAIVQADAITKRAAARALGKKKSPKLIVQGFCSLFLFRCLEESARKSAQNLASIDIKSLSRMADALDLCRRVASY